LLWRSEVAARHESCDQDLEKDKPERPWNRAPHFQGDVEAECKLWARVARTLGEAYARDRWGIDRVEFDPDPKHRSRAEAARRRRHEKLLKAAKRAENKAAAAAAATASDGECSRGCGGVRGSARGEAGESGSMFARSASLQSLHSLQSQPSLHSQPSPSASPVASSSVGGSLTSDLEIGASSGSADDSDDEPRRARRGGGGGGPRPEAWWAGGRRAGSSPRRAFGGGRGGAPGGGGGAAAGAAAPAASAGAPLSLAQRLKRKWKQRRRSPPEAGALLLEFRCFSATFAERHRLSTAAAKEPVLLRLRSVVDRGITAGVDRGITAGAPGSSSTPLRAAAPSLRPPSPAAPLLPGPEVSSGGSRGAAETAAAAAAPAAVARERLQPHHLLHVSGHKAAVRSGTRPYVAYDLSVLGGAGSGRGWLVERRFSQFDQLVCELRRQCPAALAASAAKLPSKFRLPSSLSEEGDQRLAPLQACLAALLSVEALRCSEPLLLFVGAHHDPARRGVWEAAVRAVARRAR